MRSQRPPARARISISMGAWLHEPPLTITSAQRSALRAGLPQRVSAGMPGRAGRQGSLPPPPARSAQRQVDLGIPASHSARQALEHALTRYRGRRCCPPCAAHRRPTAALFSAHPAAPPHADRLHHAVSLEADLARRQGTAAQAPRRQTPDARRQCAVPQPGQPGHAARSAMTRPDGVATALRLPHCRALGTGLGSTG